MSKVRLNEIENRFRVTLKIFDLADDDDLLAKDMLWLIEQNKRYREALEFYADEETWSLYDHHGRTFIGIDGGMRARKALEGEE